MTELLTTDVLVLGSGIAGATAALELADRGVEVIVATRAAQLIDTNTWWAQGGIIYEGVNDSPDKLAADILRAGAGRSLPSAVQILAEEGPPLLEQLLIERVGVEFDQHDGELSLAREGGHSIARIVHVADHTGSAIEQALANALVSHPRITILTRHTAIDLLTPSHHARNRLSVYEPRSCIGAYLLDQESGRVRRCMARATILATGGLGQIYLRTTNPAGSRGDGMAMAHRAGARAINMEYIQFHPTTFFVDGKASFLISEAVRGDGARLVHANGEPFMQRHAPEWKDLAPRDVVARSIHREMLEKDVTHVYLDLRTYIERTRILSHFPTIYENCLRQGVDITQELVPVVPAAHYACGGVWSDEFGRTTVDRLYAVGEVSCTGVHGANRLASTSLLEGLVWGSRAARHAVERMESRPLHDPDDIPAWRDDGRFDPDPALVTMDMSSIQNIMWNYVGLARTSWRLERALRELVHLEAEIEAFYRRSRLSDGLIGLRNAARTAHMVAIAAWQNTESAGAHYRE